jgi:hypothetical protein
VSHGVIGLLFGIGGAAVLVVLALALRRAARAGDLDASFVLVAAVGGFFVTPAALVTLAGALQRRPDSFGNLIVLEPGWYQRVDDVCVLLVTATAIVLVVRAAAIRAIRINAAGVAALGLWAVVHVSSGLAGTGISSARGLAWLVCLLAATCLPLSRGACVAAGAVGSALLGISGILAAFHYDTAFVVPCLGACGGLGFTGLLPNENLLGVALTASIPFAFLGFRGSARVLLPIVLAGGAIATGSRTAELGSVLILAALAVVRPTVDGTAVRGWRLVAAWTTLVGAIGASAFFVLHHWSPTSLTTRPELWAVAKHYIAQSPWFGYGPLKWATLYNLSQIPYAAQHTSHNLWTDVLFAAGGVGLALFAVVAVLAIARAGRGRSGSVLVLATMILIGATEGSWTIGTLDLLSFTLVAFLLTGEPSAPLAVRAKAPQASRPTAARHRPIHAVYE